MDKHLSGPSRRDVLLGTALIVGGVAALSTASSYFRFHVDRRLGETQKDEKKNIDTGFLENQINRLGREVFITAVYSDSEVVKAQLSSGETHFIAKKKDQKPQTGEKWTIEVDEQRGIYVLGKKVKLSTILKEHVNAEAPLSQ